MNGRLNRSPSEAQVSIPSSRLKIVGTDRRSGPGYTIWRDWNETAWIDAILHYDSYNGSEETVPVAIVGVYLDAAATEAIGILVRKRLQDGLKDRFLVPLTRVRGLLALRTAECLAGDATQLIQQILATVEGRIREAAEASRNVQTAVSDYAEVIGALLDACVSAGVEVDEQARLRISAIR